MSRTGSPAERSTLCARCRFSRSEAARPFRVCQPFSPYAPARPFPLGLLSCPYAPARPFPLGLSALSLWATRPGCPHLHPHGGTTAFALRIPVGPSQRRRLCRR
eukprot:scaffold31664_cov73-Isochrysis_galbana.AAC.1